MSKQFSPGYEAIAAVPFTAAGVKYAKGVRYPYRELGVIEFDLRGLWAAERIEFTGTAYGANAAPVTPPATQQPQKPQQQSQQRR